MGKHTLFLLKPGFSDSEDGPFFCPHNAAVEGLLKYEPSLKTKLDIHHVEFEKPRSEIVELLGEENQFTPVLVVDASRKTPEEAQVSASTGRAFFLGEIAISNFFHKEFSTPKPH